MGSKEDHGWMTMAMMMMMMPVVIAAGVRARTFSIGYSNRTVNTFRLSDGMIELAMDRSIDRSITRNAI